MNHIEMTLICDVCTHNLEDCKDACLGDTCKIKEERESEDSHNRLLYLFRNSIKRMKRHFQVAQDKQQERQHEQENQT